MSRQRPWCQDRGLGVRAEAQVSRESPWCQDRGPGVKTEALVSGHTLCCQKHGPSVRIDTVLSEAWPGVRKDTLMSELMPWCQNRWSVVRTLALLTDVLVSLQPYVVTGRRVGRRTLTVPRLNI